jgi:MoxR-like ATPase
MIPDAPREKIIEAMQYFDQEQRHTPAWVNWQTYENFKYAIYYEGQAYPVKQIVSIATEAATDSFNTYDAQRFLEIRGFNIVPLEKADEENVVLAAWQQSLKVNNPYVKELVKEFPTWLNQTYGEKAEFIPQKGSNFAIKSKDSIKIWGRYNVDDGIYFEIPRLTEDKLSLLKEGLSKPETIKDTNPWSIPSKSFKIYNAGDYKVVKEIVRRIVEEVEIVQLPPDPLDGSAFVVLFRDKDNGSHYGQTYIFGTNAGGAYKKLIEAVETLQKKNTAFYLLIYRPYFNRSFVAWAKVIRAEELPPVNNERQWQLNLEQHEFTPYLSLKGNAFYLREKIRWLSNGLDVANTIRQISADDFKLIIDAARPPGVTDATYNILAKRGGNATPITEILNIGKKEGLFNETLLVGVLNNALNKDNRFVAPSNGLWMLREAIIDTNLPLVWDKLTDYYDFAGRLAENDRFTSELLLEAARRYSTNLDENVDGDSILNDLRQLRLIERVEDRESYRVRYFSEKATDTAIKRLMALALLMAEDELESGWKLPSREIIRRSGGTFEDFAPELSNADSAKLLNWYAEAGLVEQNAGNWQFAQNALNPLANPDNDPTIAEYNRFLKALQSERQPETDYTLRPVQDLDEKLKELGRELLFDSTIVKRVYNSLVAGRHVVLSGPPGTGKTELAKRLPSLLWQEIFDELTFEPEQPIIIQRIKEGYYPYLVTATEDWGVRDVISGIEPRLSNNSVQYDIKYGCLTRALLDNYEGDDTKIENVANLKRNGYTQDGKQYKGVWLVIDEFTRAPVDAAFGSLLTTLGGGKNATLAVQTRNGGVNLPLPADFRIIGTLNSFDRHFLNQISEALKRRFNFIDVLPPAHSDRNYEQGIALKRALQNLHERKISLIQADNGIYRWENVLEVVPIEVDGLIRYKFNSLGDDAASQAITSFWRIFEAIRVFRQMGTAQAEAVYTLLFAAVVMGTDWTTALDYALADTLADQLQVLTRDEQQILMLYLKNSSDKDVFAKAVKDYIEKRASGRTRQLLMVFHEADTRRGTAGQDEIKTEEGTEKDLSEAQISRLFDFNTRLQLPDNSLFKRRLHNLMGDRGL